MVTRRVKLTGGEVVLTRPPRSSSRSPAGGGEPAGPGFAYKIGWLAIRGIPEQTLVELCIDGDARPVGLEEGVKEAEEFGCFVTPPTRDGWVLVASKALLEMCSPPMKLKLQLELLSKGKENEAQYFASDRTIDLYAWARARGGRCERLYVHDGFDVAADEGKRGPGEPPKSGTPSEKDVVELAARWSVDPRVLTRSFSTPEPRGWAGQLRDSF